MKDIDLHIDYQAREAIGLANRLDEIRTFSSCAGHLVGFGDPTVYLPHSGVICHYPPEVHYIPGLSIKKGKKIFGGRIIEQADLGAAAYIDPFSIVEIRPLGRAYIDEWTKLDVTNLYLSFFESSGKNGEALFQGLDEIARKYSGFDVMFEKKDYGLLSSSIRTLNHRNYEAIRETVEYFHERQKIWNDISTLCLEIMSEERTLK